MGIYLNPDNEAFASMVANDVYVDKTGLIAYMNGQIGKAKHLIAFSGSGRFRTVRKDSGGQMFVPYYSNGCDSRAVFENLEFARDESKEAMEQI